MAELTQVRPLHWTLIDFGDLAVCIHALSDRQPVAARILVMAVPPCRSASRLALELTQDDGRRRLFALAAMSPASVGAVALAGSVVVIEEDMAAPAARRHAYVARVVHQRHRTSRAAAPQASHGGRDPGLQRRQAREREPA